MLCQFLAWVIQREYDGIFMLWIGGGVKQPPSAPPPCSWGFSRGRFLTPVVGHLQEIDLTDPRMRDHAVYARLREEAPVARVHIGGGIRGWLVTRYDDTVVVLKDERFANDRRNAQVGGLPLMERAIRWSFGPLVRHLLGRDRPDHTRLRGLVQKAFTTAAVEAMRPRIESLTIELLDRVAATGQFDLVRDYALPLPITVIAEMFGVPPDERDRFHRWARALVDISGLDLFTLLRTAPRMIAYVRYLRLLIRRRREHAGTDLISALVAAEEAGDKLSEGELLAMIYLLLVAGYETTVNLIANGTLALLENPEQLRRLRSEPALVESAIEELARYYSPIETSTVRMARCDLDLQGVTVRRGAVVVASLASANRDPRQFPNPDALDLGRSPNRHLAFGQGIHYCLGAPLGRLESQIAFRTLLARFPELHLAVPHEQLRWRNSLILRGLESLPVSRNAGAHA